MFLDSALPLTKSLRHEIKSLGQRTEALAEAHEVSRRDKATSHSYDDIGRQLVIILGEIRALLDRINRETPLLQLAITASGENLSTSLPSTISPSRLLQASTLLTVGDTHYSRNSSQSIQIGPAFCVSLYMLFVGHASPSSANGEGLHPRSRTTEGRDLRTRTTTATYGLGEADRKPLWQEVIHKARVRLCRASRSTESFIGPGSGGGEPEFEYYLEIVEDLDDGRVHSSFDDASLDGPFNAGIRESILVHQLSKLFYTDSGKLLNISQDTEGGSNPVLLLKRDINRESPDLSDEKVPGSGHVSAFEACSQVAIEYEEADEQTQINRQLQDDGTNELLLPGDRDRTSPRCLHGSFPKHLDPEWIAMEMYDEDIDPNLGSDREYEDDCVSDEEEDAVDCAKVTHLASGDAQLEAQIRDLSLQPIDGVGSMSRPQQMSHTELSHDDSVEAEDFIARSPFGAITTSLSLLEMLVRLASLQEFQQAPHLSIPDHILTFFLEQTSTVGLSGEAGTRVRAEVRRKVGFDPYSDKPSGVEE